MAEIDMAKDKKNSINDSGTRKRRTTVALEKKALQLR
jgi:hypothetical protein